jgi:hypothetical protein
MRQLHISNRKDWENIKDLRFKISLLLTRHRQAAC